MVGTSLIWFGLLWCWFVLVAGCCWRCCIGRYIVYCTIHGLVVLGKYVSVLLNRPFIHSVSQSGCLLVSIFQTQIDQCSSRPHSNGTVGWLVGWLVCRFQSCFRGNLLSQGTFGHKERARGRLQLCAERGPSEGPSEVWAPAHTWAELNPINAWIPKGLFALSIHGLSTDPYCLPRHARSLGTLTDRLLLKQPLTSSIFLSSTDDGIVRMIPHTGKRFEYLPR